MTMISLTRQLVALDMLCLELADHAQPAEQHQAVTDKYLQLLQQFCQLAQKLSESAEAYSDYQFVSAVNQAGLSIQFKNKRMLLVYRRLSEFALEYYQVNHKIMAIRDSQFDAHAEQRLQLLQTRAIKAKVQFKTVAQALGKKDYQQFVASLGLPAADWDWQVLRLEAS